MLQIFPVEYLKIEPNFDKLPIILDKLKIKNEKTRLEITKTLENKENNPIIIELLEEMANMMGEKRTSMNEYRWYCVNRDLKQNGSPIYHENNPSYNSITHWPHDNVKLTVNELIEEYKDIVYKKGLIPPRISYPITKYDMECVLQYLLDHDVIYTYNVGELFDDPANKKKEYDDVMEHDYTIKCLKIY